MNLYHALQLAVAAWVIMLVVRGFRSMLWDSDLDAEPYLAAIRQAIEAGADDDVRRLIQHGQPAWIARIAEASLNAEEEVDEVLFDLIFVLEQRVRPLRVLGRVSSSLGMLGAAGSVIWFLAADHGLAALEAGRVERTAIESGLLSIAIGLATAIVAHTAGRIFQRSGERLHRECRSAIRRLSLVEKQQY